MAIRVAINGFGRIGRAFLRSVLLDQAATKYIDIVAINEGPSASAQMDLLFRYDSVMGTFPEEVIADAQTLTIGAKKILRYAIAHPADLPWEELGIDWVIEASGFFTSREKAALHTVAGAKKVLITAPSKDADCMIVPGVNSEHYDRLSHHVVSLASCTTNCFAPILKVITDQVTMQQGTMTTIHAYTNTQALLDVVDKDPRKARAAALNIIPSHTGASDAMLKLFPFLQGKLTTMAIRVPVPNVSFIDFSFVTEEILTKEMINDWFRKAALHHMKGVIEFTDKPLVSSDYVGNSHAAIFDSLLTISSGNMSKVCAWYDNEFGYSSRIKEFLLHNR